MHTSDQQLSSSAHRSSASHRSFLTGTARLAGGVAIAVALGATSTTVVARPAFAQATSGGVDPQMQWVLDAYAMPIQTVIPRQARELPSFRDAVEGALAAAGRGPAVEMVGRIEHRLIPGGAGSEGTLVRIYTPSSPPFPVLVYFHGGGWVIANLNVYDASPRALTNAAEAVVISVAYRQAPESKFPAAVDDAFAAYQWALANASSFGGDPACVAVGGGNLATVVAHLARDGDIMPPTSQLLHYPVTDFAGDYPSYQTEFNDQPLSTPALHWFGDEYLRSDADRQDFRASPMLAPSLRGLPAATIIPAEFDPLRDPGAAYAAKLHDAGVPVTDRPFAGVTHEFFGMAAVVDRARAAQALAADGSQAGFSQAPGK